MATGPYRTRIARPSECERHGGAPRTERCARCGSHLCHECIDYVDRVLCGPCAAGMRRRRAFSRIGVALLVAIAGASTAIIGVASAPAKQKPSIGELRRVGIKVALRECSEPEILFVLLGLHEDDRYAELVAAADAFTEACGAYRQVTQLAHSARARLARP
ncbi:Hypothetical protein A7982_06423 [Minicystis rosea]|nr:Hypothetical protein A7982_06423 [Minicystis rosea]